MSECKKCGEAAERVSQLEKLNSVYVTALTEVQKLGKMELMCDPADWEFDAEDAYRGGSHNAFCQAAEIAEDALKESRQEGKDE